MSFSEHVEHLALEKAKKMYSLMEDEVPSLFNRKKWKGKIIGWAVQDQDFRARLLRFVDVLPTLTTDSAVYRIFQEYFSDVDAIPPELRITVDRLSRRGDLDRVVPAILKRALDSLAGQFIAGKTVTDALSTLRAFRQQGLAASLDVVGEEVLSDDEADQYVNRYLEIMNVLVPATGSWQEMPLLDNDDRGPIPRLDVSLKATSFYSQLDPVDWDGSIISTSKNLASVFRAAHEKGASVTIDMEQYYLKDITIEIFKALLLDHPDFQYCGIVLQTYLPETAADLTGLVDWARKHDRRLGVRLVKGAYWDYETVVNPRKGWPIPVFLEKEKTDLHYEQLTKVVMDNIDYIRPAFASHNVRSLSYAMAVAEDAGLPKNALEFQMIYGMAEPVRKAVQKMGYRVRAYIPIGELIPGMAFLIRRLLENTFSESFLKRSFFDNTGIELMRSPQLDESFVQPPASIGFMNEPVTDFSKARNRTAMYDALAWVEENLGNKYPLIIEDREVFTDETKLSVNPARPEQLIGRVCMARREQAQEAVYSAREAFAAWKKTSPQERADYLFRAAAEMRKRRFKLAALEIVEVGKTWKDADGDIAEAIDYLEYYGREMIRLDQTALPGAHPGEENIYFYEPLGIGLVISPWNFPIAIPTGMVSAALVTGNTVLFKPSGLSSICGWQLAEIFKAVGLPPGVLQFVPGPGNETGEYLVSHPEIDFVSFTGSREVGLHIVSVAGKTEPGQRGVKRVIAEMGGKNAIIIDETADLDEAVKGVLDSALDFQGQKCSACSRVIVMDSVYEDFTVRLQRAMSSLRIGPTDKPGNFFGPVVDRTSAQRIQKYIEAGIQEGHALLARPGPENGFFIGPHLIADLPMHSSLMTEEIFGPVLVLVRAFTLDEALRMANDSQYALTGGVFSRSPRNIQKVMTDFDVGNLYINRKITGALVGRQPFGGFRMSGLGYKAGGPNYLIQFMHDRSVSENTLRKGFAPSLLG